ncbi:MAG: NAD-dependent epimerase/dehydratase family protein [Verrucomicrobia bacterium]|nr:NAD-dependent epimerase/dehydratase family protein [Verrucomicrobiota bacterium]
MAKRILITGGAGFIGSHLADELLEGGNRVRVLDSLSPQVHGENTSRPGYLSAEVELLAGDVRDPEAVRRALKGVDAVYHLAAKVGVGQSMYQIGDYMTVNNGGTAVLLDALVKNPVSRLVVASSMSIYGEGLFRAPDGTLVQGGQRSLAQLKARDWELRDAEGGALVPVPTPEAKEPALASVYALSKFDQERMCLIVGQAYGIPTVALRFFNVYGPRQALSNPYTGVLAIFAAQLLNGRPPLIFEDGRQQRDFVNVRDVVRACHLALKAPDAAGRVFNIGSGRRFTVSEIAEELSRILGRHHIAAEVTQRYRIGDIRHCFADITLARTVLGYEPKVTFERGMQDLAAWLEGQIAVSRVGEASRELFSRGLTA